MNTKEINAVIENIVSGLSELEKEFDRPQMSQIRVGLERGLDVSKYADPRFDCDQMYEIREGLEKGVDVSKYANPEFSYQQMEQIRKGLEKET